MDLALFPKDAIRPGDLVEVAVLRNCPSDEEPAPSTTASNITNGAESRRPDVEGVTDSVAEDSAVDEQHTDRSTVHDQGRGPSRRQRCYVFMAKEMSPELKQKYHNLQVSHTPATSGTSPDGRSMLIHDDYRYLSRLT